MQMDEVTNTNRKMINELKRTIALLSKSTAPNRHKVLADCRANIRWLRRLERKMK